MQVVFPAPTDVLGPDIDRPFARLREHLANRFHVPETELDIRLEVRSLAPFVPGFQNRHALAGRIQESLELTEAFREVFRATPSSPFAPWPVPDRPVPADAHEWDVGQCLGPYSLLPPRLAVDEVLTIQRVSDRRTGADVVVRGEGVEAHVPECRRRDLAGDLDNSKVQTRQAGGSRSLANRLQLHAYPFRRAETREQFFGAIEDDVRFAVDGQIVWPAQVMLDPVIGDGQQLLARVTGERLVVRPHHGKLHLFVIAGFEKPLVQPGAEFLVPVAPVPVVDEEGQPVLHSPLDVPVGHFRSTFLVPAEERIPFGQSGLSFPLGDPVGRPAGGVVNADLVVGLAQPESQLRQQGRGNVRMPMDQQSSSLPPLRSQTPNILLPLLAKT